MRLSWSLRPPSTRTAISPAKVRNALQLTRTQLGTRRNLTPVSFEMRSEIIVKAVCSVVFVLLGGVFSGLSLGLMGTSGVLVSWLVVYGADSVFLKQVSTA
jgi:hypothetical protein